MSKVEREPSAVLAIARALSRLLPFKSTSSTVISAAVEAPLGPAEMVPLLVEAVERAGDFAEASDYEGAVRELRLCAARYSASDDRVGRLVAVEEGDERKSGSEATYDAMRGAFVATMRDLAADLPVDASTDFFIVFRYEGFGSRRNGWAVAPFFPEAQAVAFAAGNHTSPVKATTWRSDHNLRLVTRETRAGVLLRGDAAFDGVYQQDLTCRATRHNGRSIYRRARDLTDEERDIFDDDPVFRASAAKSRFGYWPTSVGFWSYAKKKKRSWLGRRRTSEDSSA